MKGMNMSEVFESRLYRCQGYRPAEAFSIREAAEIFATRAAHRRFGKRGYCHHVRQDSRAMNGSFYNYEAFIGVDAYGGGTNGHNIWLTVYPV